MAIYHKYHLSDNVETWNSVAARSERQSLLDKVPSKVLLKLDTKALFSSQVKIFTLSYRIFGHMHRILNVDKIKTNYTY